MAVARRTGIRAEKPVKIRFQPAAEYVNATAPGLLRLQYVVNEAGRADPTSVRILYTTHPALVAPALAVIRESEFHPAEVRGCPLKLTVQQLVRLRRGSPVR